jgi:hypothetical protein
LVAPSFRHEKAPRRRVTFRAYLRRRLGPKGGRTAWLNFFVRPFSASSFAQFWRLWNPVYGYFLFYYSYRPLTQMMPRALAKLTTFVACGLLLHDVPAWLLTRRVLPPGATIAFTLFGLGAIASERFHMDTSRLPVGLRAGINGAYLVACIGLMLLVVGRLVV